jgi:hypothetical protein
MVGIVLEHPTFKVEHHRLGIERRAIVKLDVVS